MKQTPQKKAKFLFVHYHNLIQSIGGELDNETLIYILAKQCALFEVRQILKEKWNIDVPGSQDEYYFWQEVKQEIEIYEE